MKKNLINLNYIFNIFFNKAFNILGGYFHNSSNRFFAVKSDVRRKNHVLSGKQNMVLG